MIDLNKVMDDIDSKKEEIARVISLSFAEGNETLAEKEFPYIYEIIKNSHFFVFKTSKEKMENSYVKGVNRLLEEMGGEPIVWNL